MANGHGGYRKPTNPAPVSGPGQHSRRTDGQPRMELPNAQYGEGAAFQELQGQATMAQAPGPVQSSQGSFPANFTGLGEPTQQPGVPVTAGAEYGAGPGLEALGQQVSDDKLDSQDLRKYLPTLIRIAEKDDTPAGTKRWVRSILANM